MHFSKLTASNVQVTCLFIQRKESKIHGAEACERYSDAVENISIRKDTNIEIWLDYIMELGIFLVSEKRIRHPNLEEKNGNCKGGN